MEHLLLCLALLTGLILVSLDLSSMQLPIVEFRTSRLVLILLYRLGVCFQVTTEICDIPNMDGFTAVAKAAVTSSWPLKSL